MNEIREDLQAIRSHVSDIKTSIAVIQTDVGHHIKRTALAESRISRIENWILTVFSALVVGLIVAAVKLLIG